MEEAMQQTSYQSILMTKIMEIIITIPISGFAGIPHNMTGIATKLKAAGYIPTP